MFSSLSDMFIYEKIDETDPNIIFPVCTLTQQMGKFKKGERVQAHILPQLKMCFKNHKHVEYFDMTISTALSTYSVNDMPSIAFVYEETDDTMFYPEHGKFVITDIVANEKTQIYSPGSKIRKLVVDFTKFVLKFDNQIYPFRIELHST